MPYCIYTYQCCINRGNVAFLCVSLGPPRSTETYNTTRLDAAAQNLRSHRQSNTKSHIPLASSAFRHGISELPKLKSQEYPAVLVVLMALLGMKSLYLKEEDTIAVQRALVLLYLTWSVLKRNWYRKAEVNKIPKIIEW